MLSSVVGLELDSLETAEEEDEDKIKAMKGNCERGPTHERTIKSDNSAGAILELVS